MIWVLNLTQMVIAIRKQLKVIIFIISAQLFFKKIAKKPFRGTVPVVGRGVVRGGPGGARAPPIFWREILVTMTS